ncbi:MAG: hypothetical protein IPH45_20915 [Bacteroidales bacterium]|nr:hypothetical protein [Bacteroidales bacterium]
MVWLVLPVPATFSNSYYIYVYNRNHITTSTASPVSFAGATINYDFTTDVSQAFGSNQRILAVSRFFAVVMLTSHAVLMPRI